MVEWISSVKAATKVLHNKRDLSFLLDINTTKKVSEKIEVYAPLVRNLQILHPGYKFEVAPIVVGAMGHHPKCLVTYVKMVGFEDKDIKLLVRRMQVKSISGSVKICKTFLNFNDF